MCYTECRLEALTEAMLLADLEQDTVDFVPNFDNSQKEPSLLPVRIPNLLLNGSSGIAVGMATNIPPHNLGELVDALSVLIHDPDATLQELLEYMPGPDFPTGGIIIGNIGILDAYRTGRGRVVVRGKTDIELLDPKSKRLAIIIKEIPYQTNKASRVEKIAELVENKNLEGISDIRDESDRSGMRIVIELKRGSKPSIVLNNLYFLTALQSAFSCNMVGYGSVENLKETNNGTRTGRFSKSPSTDPYLLVLVIDDFKLEKCLDGLFDSFARLDSRIYSVGQTAANVGDHLQMLKMEHKKAEESHFQHHHIINAEFFSDVINRGRNTMFFLLQEEIQCNLFLF
ncbi:DNA gyrase subunit A, chloroplastic/mitochondrial-like isoform X2 [Salvia miltiorrhiza]|uniref:DNA gyrase subunit A, chloroplastic/mitochondrial-like isoform X2 n=1 Tax=Salvia miltiorrhiza TaxID=226208 RepID=UPI0025AC87EA|nr:DNA gyrase subunit A, chloroplastic/mitochondrial-like isoform X2 [Salvia miltiorrhiza]